MNNEFYTNPSMTGGEPGSPLYYGNMIVPNQQTAPSIVNMGTGAPPESIEDSEYIEDVLKLIEPIRAKFYMTFTGSNEWRDKVFDGILEATGKDHVILSNPSTGKWTLLPNIYVDYIEFDEDIKNFLRNDS